MNFRLTMEDKIVYMPINDWTKIGRGQQPETLRMVHINQEDIK